MAATTTVKRRGAKAAAAERAARERRQLYLVIGLVVVLAIVVVIEVLPRLGGGSSATTSSSTTVPAVSPTAGAPATSTRSTRKTGRNLRRALRQPARDPFVGAITPAPDTLGSVPNPPGLRDPFSSPSAPASIAASLPKVSGPAIRGTIVIGKPGAGRVAERGWIVILASIPTGKGKSAAVAFSSAARRAGVSAPTILNSSNRRPLRGGYWVVYTGPFATLPEVNRNASAVHGRGFTAAYVRQLVVYKKKS